MGVVPALLAVKIVSCVLGHPSWFGWLSGLGLIPLAGVLAAWQHRDTLGSPSVVAGASIVCSASLWWGDLATKHLVSDGPHRTQWLIACLVAVVVIPVVSAVSAWAWNRRAAGGAAKGTGTPAGTEQS